MGFSQEGSCCWFSVISIHYIYIWFFFSEIEDIIWWYLLVFKNWRISSRREQRSPTRSRWPSLQFWRLTSPGEVLLEPLDADGRRVLANFQGRDGGSIQLIMEDHGICTLTLDRFPKRQRTAYGAVGLSLPESVGFWRILEWIIFMGGRNTDFYQESRFCLFPKNSHSDTVQVVCGNDWLNVPWVNVGWSSKFRKITNSLQLAKLENRNVLTTVWHSPRPNPLCCFTSCYVLRPPGQGCPAEMPVFWRMHVRFAIQCWILNVSFECSFIMI